MSKENSLKIILIVSFIGVLFSGYLSYKELFTQACGFGCTTTGNILGIPVCVYGFLMFLAVFLTALFGLNSKKK